MARFIMASSSGMRPCIAIMYCSGSWGRGERRGGGGGGGGGGEKEAAEGGKCINREQVNKHQGGNFPLPLFLNSNIMELTC